MVHTMKVYPKGLGREAYRVIKISGSATLNGLCKAILDSFDFTDDHLYEFCMDNKMYSRDSYLGMIGCLQLMSRKFRKRLGNAKLV